MSLKKIIQLGTGNVGKALIKWILSDPVREEIRYIGIANSRSALINPERIPEHILEQIVSSPSEDALDSIQESVRYSGDLTIFDKILKNSDDAQLIVIDVTASELTAPFLSSMAKRGASLLLANKKPLVKNMNLFDTLNRVALGCRATVGTGLPVLQKISELKSSGRSIEHIEGCFSGTLGILCSEMELGGRFSEVVKNAYDRGYTEPDPREDLMGWDAARKILIISRYSGWRGELTDVHREQLFPNEMSQLPVEKFLDGIKKLDALMDKRFLEARNQGMTLRYVATCDRETLSAGLQKVPLDSPFGQLKGAGKATLIYTHQYHDYPYFIAGSGAGAESTAQDLLLDLKNLL